jgi:transposase-like protein
MNSHKHARLTPKGRALLVSRVLDEGWSVSAASEAAGVSKRTGFKWLARFKAEGAAGLSDRSSRPLRSPRSLTSRSMPGLKSCGASAGRCGALPPRPDAAWVPSAAA